MANSVDPDVTAQNEPSHLELHCLQKCMYWSGEIKGLTFKGVRKGQLSRESERVNFQGSQKGLTFTGVTFSQEPVRVSILFARDCRFKP